MINDKLVKVYPTPARDIINVVLQDVNTYKDGVVSIHSLNGKLLQSTKISGTTSLQLNVSKLPAGMYMMRIVSGDQWIDNVISVVD